MQGYSKYIYDGPVLRFDKIATDHWRGETMAPSENKARSNLAYHFKQQYGLESRTKITLPGTLKKID